MKKKKWTTLDRKACYRPNLKWSFRGINKNEMRHKHREKLELSSPHLPLSLPPPASHPPKKNEVCSLLTNGIICGKPLWWIKKQYIFETKRLINQRLGCITKVEILLLKSCGNFLVINPKNWGNSYP